jgi:hypothetical protein
VVVHVSSDGSQWGDLGGDTRSAKLTDCARRGTNEGGHCDGVLLLLRLELSFRLSGLEWMFFQIESRFWYRKDGRKKQTNTTRMSERWNANLPDRRDTLYSYHAPREGTTELQALHLLLSTRLSPWLACLLSHRTQAGRGKLKRQTPHGNAQRVNPAARPWVFDVLRLGKKQTARDGRVSETYCRDRLARVNGSRAGKKARTRSKIPWVPKR